MIARSDRVAKARMRPVVVALTLALVAGGVACSTKKNETELANDALEAGLKAQGAGRLAEAAADYREVLVHDPNNKYAYYDLGLIDHLNGALASAESNYRLALNIDPNFVSALFNLAILKTSQEDLESAIELYETAIEAQPDYAEAHLNLGFALQQDGQKKQGRAELDKAIKLDPTLASRIPAEPSGAGGPGSEQEASETPTPSVTSST